MASGADRRHHSRGSLTGHGSPPSCCARARMTQRFRVRPVADGRSNPERASAGPRPRCCRAARSREKTRKVQDKAVGRRFPTGDLVQSAGPLLRDGYGRNFAEQLLGIAVVQLATVVTRKLGRVSRVRRPAADDSGAHASVFQYPHRSQRLLVKWLMVQDRDVGSGRFGI